MLLAARRLRSVDRLRVLAGRVRDATVAFNDAVADQRAAENDVATRSKALGALFPVALRLSRFPTETLLAISQTPEGAVGGVLAAQGIAADLASQVSALRGEQQRARALATSVTRLRAVLSGEQGQEAQEAASLDQEISQADRERAGALGEAATAARAAVALAAQAQDLSSAIALMDRADRRAADAARHAEGARRLRGRKQQDEAAAGHEKVVGFAGPNGSPARVKVVAGEITRQWGASTEDGRATGITYATAPGSFVASPCTGRVAFAAPFRTYGRLMIIQCGQGFDFVLAGMDRLAATAGVVVQAGEPIGRMRQVAAGGTGTQSLYVELRKSGQPVNPGPYLNGKP